MADAAENKQSFKRIVEWTRDAIDKQFVQVIPLLEQNDVLVAANTEFAATGIAEYCKKPFVRTAFAPFLPGEKMPPPAFPYPKPNPIFTPKLLWLMMNRVSNYMVKDTINKNRAKYGLAPIRNFGQDAGKNSDNFCCTVSTWDIPIRFGMNVSVGISVGIVLMILSNMTKRPIVN